MIQYSKKNGTHFSHFKHVFGRQCVGEIVDGEAHMSLAELIMSGTELNHQKR
jgi:hypothetical protein